MARLYRRTEAGGKAWDTQNGQVALDYRRVLGLLGQDILDELEDQGLVHWFEPDSDRTDLDFTGKLALAELHAAALESARESLDFTGAFSIAELRGSHKKTV
jgi:hypothetical protein